MKNLKFIFLTFLLSFTIFCSSAPRKSVYGTYEPKSLLFFPKTYEFEQLKIFNNSFDEVWSALLSVLYESNMLVGSADKTAGIISLQEWITTDTLIESRYCDCGRHSFKVRTYRGMERRPVEQLDDPRTAHTVFYVNSRDSFHTEIKILNEFHISYATQTSLMEKWVTRGVAGLAETRYPEFWKCESTGKLESQLFQMIETKLLSEKSVSPKDH
jgi:hypothetical protein